MNIIKNYIYNRSYQILNIILPLITVPYVSNILGAEGVGDYSFTNANMQYFIIFGMIGITLYGNRQIAYVRDNKEKLSNTFYSIYSLQLITITIAIILYVIFINTFASDAYKYLYLSQGINIIAALFDISWLFMGLEEFRKIVIRNTMVKLASLASVFIFVRSSDDVVIYSMILGLSTLIGNLTFWMYIPRSVGLKNIKVSNVKLHFKSSIALFIPQIAIQIYLLLDRTLLGILSDSIQVGYYENSQKVVKMVLTIATTIGTVMMPKIANTVSSGNMDKVKYYIKNSFYFVSALSIPLMFGLMGVSKELSPWFFTDKFEGINNLIVISSIIIISISWSNVFGMQLLVPLNKTKEFTISVTSGAIVNLILNLIMLKRFGALGACISTVIAESIVTLVQFYFIKEFIDIKELFQSIKYFIPSSVIMFVVIRIIGEIMGAGIITNIIQFILGVIVYFLAVEIIHKTLNKVSIVTNLKLMLKS